MLSVNLARLVNFRDVASLAGAADRASALFARELTKTHEEGPERKSAEGSNGINRR